MTDLEKKLVKALVDLVDGAYDFNFEDISGKSRYIPAVDEEALERARRLLAVEFDEK